VKLFVFLTLVSATLLANELPPPVLPAGVGVNIHFVRGQEKDLDLIAAAGFKWIRMDFTWESIEKTNGVYDWSDYDALTANLQKRGLSAIYILDYSNPLYEGMVDSKNGVTQAKERGVASPQHPDSVIAYGRWAAAAAVHFRGKHIIWELWNEPNGSFWKPKPSALQYSALANSTSMMIRDAEPRATIIGPACAGFDWPFLERFMKSGALQYLDAVSVHPYRGPQEAPETAATDYEKLRALIDMYAPDDRKGKIPIISGEWGYSTQTGGVSLETQAAYAVRQQLSNLLRGIPISIWYDWKNDGPDAGYNEHNFGAVMSDLTFKPAYTAIKTLTRELADHRILRRIQLDEKDYALVFVGSYGGCKVAAWTLAGPHAVTINAPLRSASSATGVNGVGRSFEPKLENERLTIELEALPKYITLR
jgi:hypothetical protein